MLVCQEMSGDASVEPIFEGSVDQLPPLRRGEKQVLGQIFSQEVARAYEVEKGRWIRMHIEAPLIQVIAKPGEVTQCPEFRKVSEDLLCKWIVTNLTKQPTAKRNSAEYARQFLNALPADLPVSQKVQKRRVPADDPRVGLRGEWGCIAGLEGRKSGLGKEPLIKRGEPLGPYRGHLLFTKEYRTHKTKPHEAYKESMPSWKNKCDSYGVDLHFVSRTDVKKEMLSAPAKVTLATVMKSGFSITGRNAGRSAASGRSKSKDIGQEGDSEIMEYVLVSSAFMVGNLTALVNDPTIDPLNEGKRVVRTNNCTVIEVQVGPWIFPIMTAQMDIHEGEELAYAYGVSYWETFADQQLDIDFANSLAKRNDALLLENARLVEKNVELEKRNKELETEVADLQPLSNRSKERRPAKAALGHSPPNGFAQSTVQGKHLSQQAASLIRSPAPTSAARRLAAFNTPVEVRADPEKESQGRFVRTDGVKRARLNPEIDEVGPGAEESGPEGVSVLVQQQQQPSGSTQRHYKYILRTVNGKAEAWYGRKQSRPGVNKELRTGKFATQEEAVKALDELFIANAVHPKHLGKPEDHDDYIQEWNAKHPQDTVQSSEAPGQSRGAIKSEAGVPQWPDSPREAAADAAAYHGVIARPKTGLFDAVVKSRKKLYLLGSYKTAKQAAVAVDLMKRHLGQNTNRNFPFWSTQDLVEAKDKLAAEACVQKREWAEREQARLQGMLDDLIKPVLGLGGHTPSRDPAQRWQAHPTASRSHRPPAQRGAGLWSLSLELVHSGDAPGPEQSKDKPHSNDDRPPSGRASEEEEARKHPVARKSTGGIYLPREREDFSHLLLDIRKAEKAARDAPETPPGVSESPPPEGITRQAAEQPEVQAQAALRRQETPPYVRLTRVTTPPLTPYGDELRSPEVKVQNDEPSSPKPSSPRPAPQSFFQTKPREVAKESKRPKSAQPSQPSKTSVPKEQRPASAAAQSTKPDQASQQQTKPTAATLAAAMLAAPAKSKRNGTVGDSKEGRSNKPVGAKAAPTVPAGPAVADKQRSQAAVTAADKPSGPNDAATRQKVAVPVKTAPVKAVLKPSTGSDAAEKPAKRPRIEATQDAAPVLPTPFRTAHSIVGASEPIPNKLVQKTATKAPSQAEAAQEGSRKRSLDLTNKESIELKTASVSERSKSIAHSSKEQSKAGGKQDTSKSSKPLSRLSAVLKGLQSTTEQELTQQSAPAKIRPMTVSVPTRVKARNTAKRTGIQKPQRPADVAGSPIRNLGGLKSPDRNARDDSGTFRRVTSGSSSGAKDAAAQPKAHHNDTSKPRSNPQPNPDLLVKIGSHNAVRDKLPFRNWKEGPADGKPASQDGAPNDGTVANGQEGGTHLPERHSFPQPATRPMSPPGPAALPRSASSTITRPTVRSTPLPKIGLQLNQPAAKPTEAFPPETQAKEPRVAEKASPQPKLVSQAQAPGSGHTAVPSGSQDVKLSQPKTPTSTAAEDDISRRSPVINSQIKPALLQLSPEQPESGAEAKKASGSKALRPEDQKSPTPSPGRPPEWDTDIPKMNTNGSRLTFREFSKSRSSSSRKQSHPATNGGAQQAVSRSQPAKTSHKPPMEVKVCDLTMEDDIMGAANDDDVLDLTDLPSSPLNEEFLGGDTTPSMGEILASGLGYSSPPASSLFFNNPPQDWMIEGRATSPSG